VEYFDVVCATNNGIRLDFPGERQLSALITAWDDGSNHQICFVRTRDYRLAQSEGEYSSMICSADLVLPADQPLVDFMAGQKDSRKGIHRFFVPVHQQEYMAVYENLGDPIDAPVQFQPLKVLSILLSSLEQREGSVFLLGGHSSTIQRAEANIRSTFPKLHVVGRVPGDYSALDEPKVISALQKSTPDMLVLGSLLEGGELWSVRHMRYIKSGIFFYEHPIMEILAGRG
jgi:UDP-N-acetyl-D-mannosaminuronic acid transferase (WecB/TagA/CpsF family)